MNSILSLKGEEFIEPDGWTTVEINPPQDYISPRGLVPKSKAPEKTNILKMDCADIIPLDDARKLSIANNILTCKNTVESGQTFFESYGYRGVRLGNNALIINSVAALLMILEAIGLPYVKYVDW